MQNMSSLPLRQSSLPPVYIFLLPTLVAVFLKLLLFPSYLSTDFEVHRNWLAITYSLPISQWYFEKTSIWTLDYPPFFAFFEWTLAQLAQLVDPEMLILHNFNYRSDATIWFQRSTVLLTDLILICATMRYIHSSAYFQENPKGAIVTFSLIAFNAGLILVDHIHFQYNGGMLGLLVLCLDYSNRGDGISLAICFSVLVLLKHLYAPLAPLFAVYLLRTYCNQSFDCNKFSCTETTEEENKDVVEDSNQSSRSPQMLLKSSLFFIKRFLSLATVALVALLLAFGPFFMQSNGFEQIIQIFSQLFPFSRGLVHAYWAPNLWAIYCAADRILLFICKIVHSTLFSSTISSSPESHGLRNYIESIVFRSISANSTVYSSPTSGLVSEVSFAVLPTIPPTFALFLVFLSMLPAIVAIAWKPSPALLVRCTVNCTLCMFMVGYHVHEKAILVPLIPLALLTSESVCAASLFLQMSAAGIFGLFPLFMGSAEKPVKGLLYASYVWNAKAFLSSPHSGALTRNSWFLATYFPKILSVLAVLFVYTEIVHPLIESLHDRGPFVVSPLISTPAEPIQRIMFPLLNRVLALGQMKFLPLMLTSIVCALLLFICWVQSYYLIWEHIFENDNYAKQKRYDENDEVNPNQGDDENGSSITFGPGVNRKANMKKRSIGEGAEMRYSNLANGEYESESEASDDESSQSKICKVDDSNVDCDDFDYLADVQSSGSKENLITEPGDGTTSPRSSTSFFSILKRSSFSSSLREFDLLVPKSLFSRAERVIGKFTDKKVTRRVRFAQGS